MKTYPAPGQRYGAAGWGGGGSSVKSAAIQISATDITNGFCVVDATTTPTALVLVAWQSLVQRAGLDYTLDGNRNLAWSSLNLGTVIQTGDWVEVVYT